MECQIDNCCLCGSEDLHFYGHFLRSAAANNLEDHPHTLRPHNVYPLELASCNNCNHIQLAQYLEPRDLFENYNYQTGLSLIFQQHFYRLAVNLTQRMLTDLSAADLRVLDIGSNDCCLLDSFKELGWTTYGVEPAKNLADLTKSEHHIFNIFFDSSSAKTISKDVGYFDLITANNVFAHTRNLKGFVEGIVHLLKSDGLFVLEVQYAIPLLENNYFDMIYHEHTSYHTLTPLFQVLPSLGLFPVEAEIVPTHGGSLRVYCSPTQPKSLHDSIKKILESEKDYIGKSLQYLIEKFQVRSLDILSILSSQILDFASSGSTVLGFAAPAKATTILNNLNPKALSCIDYVIDDAPYKRDKCIPGTAIYIRSREFALSHTAQSCHSSIVIIFAWNIAVELIQKIKEANIFDQGKTRFLIPLPQPTVIES